MIMLFTDFGLQGPYVGEIKAVLHRLAPEVAVIDLMHDAPAGDPCRSAYLLAALVAEFPPPVTFLAVVDPGVGGARPPIMVKADGRWFVGPGNGLFELVLRRAESALWWEIAWRPARLTPSFHGRDLFAPVAAGLARNRMPAQGRARPAAARRPGWPDDLAQVIYIDGFGNAVTGLQAAGLAADAVLQLDGRRLDRARTFSDVPSGAAFWYENSNGLAEIAVNGGRADRTLGLEVGTPIRPLTGGDRNG